MANLPLDKLRVMLDANVLFAAIGWPRFPYEVVQHAIKGDFKLVLSPRIIYEARGAVAFALPKRIKIFEATLEATNFDQVVDPTADDIFDNAGLVRDIKDVHVALAAMSAGVDYLISQDRDLTEIYESNQPLHDKVKVILPAALLRQ